jgi:hypothetical protein
MLLVGGLEHEWIMTVHSVENFIILTSSIIFQRGREKPPTSIEMVECYRMILMLFPCPNGMV